jgi:cytidylate kinase
MNKALTIAIDGPGSAGKGTVARGVAQALAYQYVDTGAMYRAVALFSERAGIPWTDEVRVATVARDLHFAFVWDGDALRIVVNDEDVSKSIRTAHVGKGASDVSALPAVRAALLELQRGLGAQGGVVMDGRDIGTVILPDSELKVFLSASLEERARRRHEELIRRGEVASYDDVQTQLAYRDKQDSERPIAPLKQAEDAILVDTTDLTIPQAIDKVLGLALPLLA